jgi:hypothetical protein
MSGSKYFDTSPSLKYQVTHFLVGSVVGGVLIVLSLLFTWLYLGPGDLDSALAWMVKLLYHAVA